MENNDKIIDKIAENTAAELNDSDLEKVSGGVDFNPLKIPSGGQVFVSPDLTTYNGDTGRVRVAFLHGEGKVSND